MIPMTVTKDSIVVEESRVAELITYGDLKKWGLHETMIIALPEAHATMERVQNFAFYTSGKKKNWIV